jgi:hypothetical protein
MTGNWQSFAHAPRVSNFLRIGFWLRADHAGPHPEADSFSRSDFTGASRGALLRYRTILQSSITYSIVHPITCAPGPGNRIVVAQAGTDASPRCVRVGAWVLLVMGSLTPRCLGGGSAVPAELAAWALKRVHFVRCERSLPAARPVPSRRVPSAADKLWHYSLRCFTFSCMLLADASAPAGRVRCV